MTSDWSNRYDPARQVFAEVDLNPPVAVAGAHLLDTDLLAPSPADTKHLAECGWCQQRQQAAGHHDDGLDEDAFLQAAHQRAVNGGTATLALLTTLSPELRALTAASDAREDVTVGQLWRLRWRDVTELAVVVNVDRWWVTVAPVTTDVNAADEFDLILPATASVLSTDFAVCFSLESTVPLFVFDRQVSPASRPTLDAERAAAQLPPPEVIKDVWRAWRRGVAGPADLTYGLAVDDADLDRRELRNAVAAGFTHLSSASSCVPGDPLGDVVPLLQQIKSLGLLPAELAARSGLDMSVFLRIKKGGRVTRDEAARLTSLLDTDISTILDANPPFDDALITEVSRPSHRPALRALAGTFSSEDDQRWKMAETIAPQAARTVGTAPTAGAGTTDWATKVSVYLQQQLTALGDPSADQR
ncbi:hypothetical protein GCM10010170_104600 [Dactylosporangium salmoneum]|uniref:HTH cro/C1-type domain-containing protein n=2 Tax=Dactylosporangium salmoneum TaxID=53361 RepID=A0ABP5V0X1_9ACTN